MGTLPDDDVLWLAYSSKQEYALEYTPSPQIWLTAILTGAGRARTRSVSGSTLVAWSGQLVRQSSACLVVEMILLLVFGCIESKTKKELEAAKEIVNYHGIEEGASWTYRDDGADFDTGTAPPEDEDLILAHHAGNGYIEPAPWCKMGGGDPCRSPGIFCNGTIATADQLGTPYRFWKRELPVV